MGTPKRRTRIPFDAAAKLRFLAVYGDTASMSQAASAAGVCAWTVRRRLRPDDRLYDADFASEVDNARGVFVDTLWEEARRRAVDGWTETRLGPDGVQEVRRYSNRLLEVLLRRYVVNRGDASGSTATVQLNLTGPVVTLSDLVGRLSTTGLEALDTMIRDLRRDVSA